MNLTTRWHMEGAAHMGALCKAVVCLVRIPCAITVSCLASFLRSVILMLALIAWCIVIFGGLFNILCGAESKVTLCCSAHKH